MRPRHDLVAALLLVLSPWLASCGDSATGPEPFDIEDVVFAEELGVDIDAMETTPLGAWYEVEEPGEGQEAGTGSEVTVHYTGYLPDGTEFDSSLGGEPLGPRTVGVANLITGFQEGIIGMEVGETRLLVLPPDLAFGEQGTSDGTIPGNSAVVFRIELLSATPPFDVEAVTFAPELGVDAGSMERTFSGLYYRDLEDGDGQEASFSSMVGIHYTGWLTDGTEFDTVGEGDPPLDFTIGTAQPIRGLQEGTIGMRVGGTRQLVVPPYLAYGEEGLEALDIPPDAVLVYEVELLSATPPTQ